MITQTYKLRYPVVVDGFSVRTIVLRPLTEADEKAILEAIAAAETAYPLGAFARSIRAIAQMSRLPLSVVHKINGKDALRIIAIINAAYARSEAGQLPERTAHNDHSKSALD